MTITFYQCEAQRTSNTTSPRDKLANGALGLAGECGECADLVKTLLFQGHKLDRDRLIEELGDVLWYCAELAVGLDTTLEEVAWKNIAKLCVRYPYGFEAQRSINRE